MRSLNVETTQHVHIHYPAAGVSDRIAAYLIDALILVIYIVAVYSLFFSISENIAGWVPMLLILLPVWFYHLAMEVFFEGQSVGKMAMQVKVLRQDGASATLGDYFIRWIFRLFEITLTSGTIALFTILFNGKGQRLGDIAAGTTVVKVNKEISLSDTVYAGTNDEYEPRYPQVAALADDDIALIEEVLAAGSKYEWETHARMMNKTRKSVEKKTGITASTDMNSLIFLQTVIKDYNAIYG